MVLYSVIYQVAKRGGRANDGTRLRRLRRAALRDSLVRDGQCAFRAPAAAAALAAATARAPRNDWPSQASARPQASAPTRQARPRRVH